MSIRAIAQELYRCQARVHDLEDRLRKADPTSAEELREQLRVARAELKTLKNMMEGRKALSSSTRKTYPFR